MTSRTKTESWPRWLNSGEWSVSFCDWSSATSERCLQATEEKEKRKEEKRLARQQAKGGLEKLDDEDQDRDESFNSKNLDVGSEAIASLSAKLIDPKLITKEKNAAEVQDNDEEEEVPILANRNLTTLKIVLDASDVLLEVLDARDPLPFRSSFLEQAMQGRKVLLVLNKIGESSTECFNLRSVGIY
jgi:nuclear GTP-binding protein